MNLFDIIISYLSESQNRKEIIELLPEIKKAIAHSFMLFIRIFYIVIKNVWFKIFSYSVALILLIVLDIWLVIYVGGNLNVSSALHTSLATFYDRGFIVDRDSMKSVNMYAKSAYNGYAPAQYYLAYHYLKDKEKTDENYKEGIKWLDKSCTKKFAPALLSKGEILIKEHKYEEGIKLLNSISYMNYECSGVWDAVVFKYIYTVAHHRFYNRIREKYLAIAYYYNKNYENFICLAKNIAKIKKNASLALTLGILLEDSVILSQYKLFKYYSLKEAKYWYEIGYKNGEKEAGFSLANLYRKLHEDEMAEQVYTELSNMQHVKAIIELSRMYRVSMPYRPIYKDSCISILENISNISGEACYELGNIYSYMHDYFYLRTCYFYKADSLGFRNLEICKTLGRDLYVRKKYKASVDMMKKGLEYVNDDYSNSGSSSNSLKWLEDMGNAVLSDKDTVLCIDSYKLYYQYTHRSYALYMMFHRTKKSQIEIEFDDDNCCKFTYSNGYIDSNSSDRRVYMELAYFYSLFQSDKYRFYTLSYLLKAQKCSGKVKYPSVFLTYSTVELKKYFESKGDRDCLSLLSDIYEKLRADLCE